MRTEKEIRENLEEVQNCGVLLDRHMTDRSDLKLIGPAYGR